MNGVSFVLVVVGRWNKEMVEQLGKWRIELCKESGSGDLKFRERRKRRQF
jgi:hypothetical protein